MFAMKKLFYLPVILLILTGCEKNESDFLVETKKIPAESVQLSRSFYYPEEDLTIAQTYMKNINTSCKLDENKNLVIDFDIPLANGKDDVTLVINKKKLKEGYTGTYEINFAPTTDVAAYYLYRLNTPASNKFLPGSSTGSLTITRYDNQFKTLTGNYNFTINSINDPVISDINNNKETIISISGSFENIKME